MYFAAGDDSTLVQVDYELHTLDTSGAPTEAATLVEAVNSSGLGQVNELVIYDGNLHFIGEAGNGSEGYLDFIFQFDGSSVTALDTLIGDADSSYNPHELTPYAGALYFTADDGENGRELWRYDGSSAELVWDVHPGSDGSDPSDLYVHDGKLFFTAYDGGNDDGYNNIGLYYYETAES